MKHQYIFSSRGGFTVKVVRIKIYDNLLLHTQSCDLLIFWSCDNQSAEFVKGTVPENSNIFETNWKHKYIFTSKCRMATKLVRIHKTWYHSWKHTAFWSFGYVIIKTQNFLKGQSHKVQIFLKLNEAQIYLNIQMWYDK